MVKLVYNLADLSFFDPSVFSYVLLPPSRYHKRREVERELGVSCFLDVDFRDARMRPEKLAWLQQRYALPGDILVAPDKLGDATETLQRIQVWLREVKRSDVELLFPLQFRSEQEAWRMLAIYKDMEVSYVGLGIFTCRLAGLARDDITFIASMIKGLGMKLHLLGFSITKWREWLPLYKIADTMDSSGLTNISLKNMYDYIRRALDYINTQALLEV